MKPRTELFETFAIQGITLRDYFAAKALTAISINQGSIGTEDYSFEEVALDAYLIADAMMKARGK